MEGIQPIVEVWRVGGATASTLTFHSSAQTGIFVADHSQRRRKSREFFGL
jgi:hypothetical protein